MSARAKPGNGEASEGRPAWPGRRAAWTIMVVGFGLMGASFALRLRTRWHRLHVVAVDRAAVGRRLVSEGLAAAHGSLRQLPALLRQHKPRLLVLALPVDGILKVLPVVAKASSTLAPKERPLVLDLGSVKETILEAAAACGCPRFIGGHPMAGSERSGHAHAIPTMFEGRPFVLCRNPGTARLDQRMASELVGAIGANPLWLSAREHDAAVALISHLPHLSAFSLLEAAQRNAATERVSTSLLAQLAAGSWRDATRVGAADPQQWTSIFFHNRPHVLAALDTWLQILQTARENLQSAEDARAFELGFCPRPLRRGRRSKGSSSPA